MAESNIVVASAVVLPDTANESEAPQTVLKRRQSSTSPEHVKRQRVAGVAEEDDSRPDHGKQQDTMTENHAQRRISRDVDERKRGKRLFGSLLGTLAQNSSSTAQKRRTDIEKKQQEKIKLQDEEDDEKKRQKMAVLVEQRRNEQIRYDEQSRLLEQSNMLAAAHFLQTKAEPKLYYKPWDLRPEEKSQIDLQIRNIEEGSKGSQPDQEPEFAEQQGATRYQEKASPSNTNTGEPDTALSQMTDEAEPSKVTAETGADMQSTESNQSNTNGKGDDAHEATKDVMDEGGDDMVEGEEDAVIY